MHHVELRLLEKVGCGDEIRGAWNGGVRMFERECGTEGVTEFVSTESVDRMA